MRRVSGCGGLNVEICQKGDETNNVVQTKSICLMKKKYFSFPKLKNIKFQGDLAVSRLAGLPTEKGPKPIGSDEKSGCFFSAAP